MSKFNNTRSKILSKKNIKGIEQNTLFSSGTISNNNSGITIATKEIIVVEHIELTNNLDLNGNETIDGVTTFNGDFVIANAQTNASEVDIYSVNSTGDWSRVDNDLRNIELIRIENGLNNKNTLFTIKSGTSRENEDLQFEEVINVDYPIKLKKVELDHSQINNLHTTTIITLPSVVGKKIQIHSIKMTGKGNFFYCDNGGAGMNCVLTDGTTDTTIATITPGNLTTGFTDHEPLINLVNQRSITGHTFLELRASNQITINPASTNLLIYIYFSYTDW